MLFEKLGLMHFNIRQVWVLEQCDAWQRQCFLKGELFYGVERRVFFTMLHLYLINLAPFQGLKVPWFYWGAVAVYCPSYPPCLAKGISRKDSLLPHLPLRQKEMALCHALVNWRMPLPNGVPYYVSLGYPDLLKYGNWHAMFGLRNTIVVSWV